MCPVVSVIIPVYNAAPFLAEAVASVWRQGIDPIEVIAIDDGSTDGGDAWLARDGRIHLLRTSPSHQGPGPARNLGITHAKAPVLAFLDADDLWPAGKLAHQLTVLRDQPAVDISGGMTRRFLSPGFRPNPPPFPPDQPDYFNHHFGAFLIRRSVSDRVGPFDPELHSSEDQDWMNRARELGCVFHRSEEVTLMYRMHGNNLTAGRGPRELGLTAALRKALLRRRARSQQN
jgi:glycosyltransferase involved in cell wall biosynthesis